MKGTAIFWFIRRSIKCCISQARERHFFQSARGGISSNGSFFVRTGFRHLRILHVQARFLLSRLVTKPRANLLLTICGWSEFALFCEILLACAALISVLVTFLANLVCLPILLTKSYHIFQKNWSLYYSLHAWVQWKGLSIFASAHYRRKAETKLTTVTLKLGIK